MKRFKEHADKYIFFTCLGVAIILMVFGAITPPPAIIDGSILTACAILLGFAALGIAGQNLANGKDVTWSHGDTEVKIEDDDNN